MTLNLSASPHVRDRWTTSFIMHTVLLSLMPAAVVGVIVYGLHALLVILASILAAVGTEALFCLLAKKPLSIGDGSAAVTGMLLALSLSPSTPVVYPILGSVFAIFVVKCCFGGLGKNFINPALAGRCFLRCCFRRRQRLYTFSSHQRNPLQRKTCFVSSARRSDHSTSQERCCPLSFLHP